MIDAGEDPKFIARRMVIFASEDIGIAQPTALVVANEVFEHVFNPLDFLGVIKRVLRPGGMLLMTVPFVWDEHEQPYDFARYSSFGIKSVLEKNGFEIIAQRKTVTNFGVIIQ